ncbi:MAG: class I SAM-dependent methyltransferase [Kofleriaceae bacterium]|nr:class I SAM-dependent methyltransferase [Kofleriaceae bacterium]MCL4224518.1 methyltransferase domain-containing protein [Myxococcales bacterium]
MTLGDFARQAQAYAARPTYPEALLDRLLVAAGVAAGDRVADLGAGTGLFTRMLAERRLLVEAVEPSQPMRAQAASHPCVRWRRGTFEATGLDDRSVRWVTAAQAFHWADPARALPELHRVLLPGGRLTCLWNDRRDQDSPVLTELMATIRRLAPGFDERYRDRDWALVLRTGGWFGEPTRDEERHDVTMSADRLRTLWRSHNHLAHHAGPALPRVLAAIDAVIDEAAATTAGAIAIPYVTRAWTARAVAR